MLKQTSSNKLKWFQKRLQPRKISKGSLPSTWTSRWWIRRRMNITVCGREATQNSRARISKLFLIKTRLTVTVHKTGITPSANKLQILRFEDLYRLRWSGFKIWVLRLRKNCRRTLVLSQLTIFLLSCSTTSAKSLWRALTKMKGIDCNTMMLRVRFRFHKKP
jgi:hypothetical protein